MSPNQRDPHTDIHEPLSSRYATGWIHTLSNQFVDPMAPGLGFGGHLVQVQGPAPVIDVHIIGVYPPFLSESSLGSLSL
jgi:hypothetical protein